MIHFVVAVGRPNAIDAIAPRLATACHDTRIFEGDTVEASAPGRTWAMAAITSPDAVSARRVAIDGDALAVVNGPALALTGSQSDVVDTLLGRYVSGGPAAVVEGLGGSYNVVAVAPGRGATAFPDFSGLYPVYWTPDGPDVALFSNRSTTIARLNGSDGWDLRPLAWVIGHANLFGSDMPARGVRYVPPGFQARVEWGGDRTSVERAPTWAWPTADSGEGRDNLTDAEWAEVTESLVGNVRALGELDELPRLRITGGKDSRLCLALAKAAGLEDRVETITTGPFDSPEVEVAAVVAKAAGFSHRRIGPPAPDPSELEAEEESDTPPPPPPPPDPAPIWRRLRTDVYRYEASICGWSALQNPTSPPVVNIKGFGGEFFRRGNAKQFREGRVPGVDELAEMFVNYHQPQDPLKVLVEDEAEFQREWLRSWVRTTAETVRLDLLPEKFYVDHRLGHWSGPLVQGTPSRIDINPLLSQLAVAKNLELSARARCAERFHFEVMRHAAPELVGIPFLNDTWAPDIVAGSPLDLPTEPFPVTVRPRRGRSWGNPGWSMLDSEKLPIEKLFHRAMGRTDMGSICDMRRLKRITRRAETITNKSAQVKELFSAISVAIALLGEDEQVVDRA